MLSTFSPSLRVTAEEAKQDNIAVDIGDWYIQDIGNHIGAFCDLIATAPPSDKISSWANLITTLNARKIEKEWFGWMLNRPAGNYDEHTELKIKGGGKNGPAKPSTPLAKGKLKIIPLNPQGESLIGTQRRKLRLIMFLNPTRFLRHQNIPENVEEPFEQWPKIEPNFVARSLPKRRKVGNDDWNTEHETSLDGNDNVLMGVSEQSFSRPDVWRQQMRAYLTAVEKEITKEFIRAASGSIVGYRKNRNVFDWQKYYSLKKVETYFEFSHHNPVELVKDLEPILISIGVKAKSRFYPNGFAESSVEGNCRCITIRLKSGCHLKVYAKTNRRIRFEVQHNLKKDSASKLLVAEGGGHTTHSEVEFLGWFQKLSLDAAKEVNGILEKIEGSMAGRDEEPASVHEFLSKLFSTIASKSRALDILNLLVTNGCFRVGEWGSDYLPEILQLRRKNVLKTVGGADKVTPRYRLALDALRQQVESLPEPIRCRERRRRPGSKKQA